MALSAIGGRLDPSVRYRLSHAVTTAKGVRPESADHYIDGGREDDMILIRRDDLAAALDAAVDEVKAESMFNAANRAMIVERERAQKAEARVEALRVAARAYMDAHTGIVVRFTESDGTPANSPEAAANLRRYVESADDLEAAIAERRDEVKG